MSTLRRSMTAAVFAATFLGAAGCGEVARTGQSPVYLIIDTLEGHSGSTNEFGSILFSDVQTLVTQTIGGQTVRVPTIFSDGGRVVLRIGLKNIGVPTAPLGPSSLNAVTITRYRVRFIRADGRNTPGVDLPHGFDGAFTGTITGGGTISLGFELVRHTMKQEPPLRNLIDSGAANQINAIAEVTFYGHDQTGNEVSVSGMLTVLFGDFGDPA